MRMNRIRLSLIEAFPEFSTGNGIFDYLMSLSFVQNVSNALSLNYDYYLNHSGYKQASLMVLRLLDTETMEIDSDGIIELANVLRIRYSAKWEQLYKRYTDLAAADFNMFSNIGLSTKTQYGKNVSESGTSTLTKSGSEVSTVRGTETREESFPTAKKISRFISGGYTDTRDLASTRTGSQDVTESYPSPKTSTLSITGSYSDADSTSSTRTGKQTVTDKGDTATTSYGFNSSAGVKMQKIGPDTAAGTTTETDYGSGIIDSKSGAVTRSYNDYSEITTEAGTNKVSTTYGEEGLKDADTGTVVRTYNDYQDEITETGSKRLEISYGNAGKTDTVSFDNRKDSTVKSDSTEYSGEDTVTVTGQKGVDNVQQYINLFENAYMLDFLEIVYNDIDNVLTCPYYV